MKLLKNIALVAALLVLTLTSCVEKEPSYGNFGGKDVDFTYNVDGDEYTLDFYVVSTIKFNNISEKSGSVTWDFGDGSTSTDQNPTHKYAKSGIYNVTLTVDGAGSRTYPLLIYDIAPVLSVVDQSAETVVINDVTVLLDIALPNPENLECKYVWTFPEGTTLEDGTPITEFTGYSDNTGHVDNPGRLKFKNIGSQKIELQTWFDINGENRRLEDSYVNVQVGSSIPCPTLYYAVYGGNIKAYKLVDMSQLPAGTKNMPFDMGVSSGNTPTTLIFTDYGNQDNILILDCGKQYYYINDENNVLGDGKITVMSADGINVNTMITNVGGQAFNDPFQGCVDKDYLYYTDRNTGIRRILLSTRGERENTVFSSTAGYFCVNNMLNYYGNGISYGAIHTGLYLDKNNVFWWGKNYSGNGIYRFRTSDIGEASSSKTGAIPFKIVLSATQPRAFTLDEELGNLYVWMCKGTTPGAGFTCYPLPGSGEGMDYDKYTTYVNMEANPENTTADEGLYTTQFAIDPISHNVFFGFRAASTEKTYTTGIKYFDPNTKTIVNFNDNTDRVLGLCVNPHETYLF